MRRSAFLFLLATACGATAQQSTFTPTKEPTLQGMRATADLPAAQHKRNVGGSDDSGLCVYTSAWHAAIWQDSRDLLGFRDWMKQRPGGSYPQKFDATLKAYCQEKGIAVPGYVQHTGGDAEFLELALKTGRMVCVTYCGVDGPQSYGNEVIGHMVNLVYLDSKSAAILDNNFPGRWLWMSRADFLARWRGVKPDGSAFLARDQAGRRMPIGGGWAIVLLAPPPAPYPALPTAATRGTGCGCTDCNCPPGACPSCEPSAPSIQFGQKCPGGRCPLPSYPAAPSCPGGRCPLPTYPTPSPDPVVDPEPEGAGRWIAHENGREWGYYVGRKCVARAYTGGRCESVDGNGNGTGAPIIPPASLPVGAARPTSSTAYPTGGVDHTRLTADEEYSISGRPCLKRDAHDALALSPSLTDDSRRWNLSAVGDPTFLGQVKADISQLPAEVRAKLHVQSYSPDHWAVSQFKLGTGLTLRKPAAGRVGGDVGTVSVGDYAPDQLPMLLAREGGPTYVAPPPVPKPAPQPQPAPVPGPTPVPAPNVQPSPTPAPATPADGGSTLLALLVAAGAIVGNVFRRGA